MRCYRNKSFDWLLKTDEPAYVVTLARKKGKRTREEIEKFVRDLFTIPKNGKSFEEIYERSLEDTIENFVKREDRLFGEREWAFIPAFDYNFVSESKLNEMIETHPYYEELNRKHHEATKPDIPFRETKYVYAEIKTSTSDALVDIQEQCGVVGYYSFKQIPIEELRRGLKQYVSRIKKDPNVIQAYLTGSLAKFSDNEFGKDLDVIVVRRECMNDQDGGCSIKEASNEEFDTSRGKQSVDLFCFSQEEFDALVDGGYRIVQEIQPLLN